MENCKERPAGRILLGIMALFRVISKAPCAAIAAVLVVQAVVPAQAAVSAWADGSISLPAGDACPARSVSIAGRTNISSGNASSFGGVGLAGVAGNHHGGGPGDSDGKCTKVCYQVELECSLQLPPRCKFVAKPVPIPYSCDVEVPSCF